MRENKPIINIGVDFGAEKLMSHSIIYLLLYALDVGLGNRNITLTFTTQILEIANTLL